MQADVEVVHGGEGHGQHQRNRQRHHQAGAHTEGEEAHQQHDHERLDQHLDELTDAGLHRRRLVGDLAQLHAGRQFLLQASELLLQCLAEHQDVAAALHRYGEAKGRLAHEAHPRCRRVVETAVHFGHITDAERAPSDADWKIANLLDRLEATGDPQLHPVADGLDETGGADRILGLQRLTHGFQRNAEGGQLDVGKLDPDLLVLQTDQLDLADVLHPLQLQLNAVGVVLEDRVVETFTGQRVDVAEGSAELVVEERSLYARRQRVTNVADLLADLIPEVGDVLRAHRVSSHEGDVGLARP